MVNKNSKIITQSAPNNLASLKITKLGGKLNFSLINKETNYIDISQFSSFNEKAHLEKKNPIS